MINELCKYIYEMPVLSIKLRATAVEDIFLHDHNGSLFRGVLGLAMKGACGCVIEKECMNCPSANSCFYYNVFETPRDKGSELMTKQSHYPHPFVIRPPYGGSRKVVSDDDFCFELMVIGNTVKIWNNYIKCVEIMGEIGLNSGKDKFILNEAASCSASGRTKILYKNGDYYNAVPDLIRLRDIYSSIGTKKPDKIKINFITPLRIQSDHKLLENIDFRTFAAGLIRRLTNLNYFHNTREKAKIDFKKIFEIAEGVKVIDESLKTVSIERFSNRQDRRHRLPGLTGYVTFSGERLSDFYPLLQFGEFTHVGKSTSFGFGQYNLEIL